MRVVLLSFATLVVSITPAADAIFLHKRDAPAVVRLSIERRQITDPVQRDHLRRKRDTTVSVGLVEGANLWETLYFCNIELGTPPQPFQLLLDTGSNDLWVNAANSSLGSPGGSDGASGTYDASASSTSKFNNTFFNLTYLGGKQITGDFVTDMIHIGGVKLDNMQFGVGYQSTEPGFVDSTFGDFGNHTVNLPRALANHGIIRSAAYSMWVDDLTSNKGSILFGGVNTAKYHEPLTTVPFLGWEALITGIMLPLTGLTLHYSATNSTTYPLHKVNSFALVDSGSSLMYLPNWVLGSIYNNLSVTFDEKSQLGYVPCSLRQENYTLSYALGSAVIDVNIHELVLDPSTEINTYKIDGKPACVFGIGSAGDHGLAALGDTFLRSAYVVYDFDNQAISLANTRFNSTEENNILEIGTGSAAVPSATPVVWTTTSADAAAHPATATSASSTGLAVLPTSNPGHLVTAGLAGAGLWLVLYIFFLRAGGEKKVRTVIASS